MSWAEDRAAMREDVHATFCFAARYSAPGSATFTDCLVRRHDNQSRFGDNDREGYGQVVEQIQRCVFDKLEIPSPERNGRIEFVDDGLVFVIDSVLPMDDARWITCDLVAVSA